MGFGPLRVDAVATSINFAAGYHFGDARVLRDGLRIGPSTWAHSVKIGRAEEIDGDLLQWLAESYRRAARE